MNKFLYSAQDLLFQLLRNSPFRAVIDLNITLIKYIAAFLIKADNVLFSFLILDFNVDLFSFPWSSNCLLPSPYGSALTGKPYSLDLGAPTSCTTVSKGWAFPPWPSKLFQETGNYRGWVRPAVPFSELACGAIRKGPLRDITRAESGGRHFVKPVLPRHERH